MRYLKMLGLAAMATLALTALVGASTASGAKVCSTTGTGEFCSSGRVVGSNTTYHETSLKLTITSTFDVVICHSTMHLAITNGSTGTLQVDAMTFTSCVDSFGSNCTAGSSASSTNRWAGTVAASGGGNGTMTIENVTIQYTCPIFGVNTTCIYSAVSGVGTFTGGEPAKFTANSIAVTRESGSGGGCSEKATWSGTFTVETPSSLWLF
jgi:hypothetical protein